MSIMWDNAQAINGYKWISQVQNLMDTWKVGIHSGRMNHSGISHTDTDTNLNNKQMLIKAPSLFFTSPVSDVTCKCYAFISG